LEAPDQVPARAAGTERPSARDVAVMVVDGPLTRADIPRLCERARALMDRAGVEALICDVGGHIVADAVTVEALARLQLAARRRGCCVSLRGASIDLLGLLSLAGLTDIVPLED
jgi:ABC-type transporter Mla MlaB component